MIMSFKTDKEDCKWVIDDSSLAALISYEPKLIISTHNHIITSYVTRIDNQLIYKLQYEDDLENDSLVPFLLLPNTAL